MPTPSLNDLWQAFLSGSIGASNRPALSSMTNAALLTSPVLVGAGQKRITTYNIFNPTAAVAYVQFFNAATAGAVTVGTTAPVTWLSIPAGGAVDGQWDFSPAFPAGLVVAATTTPTGSTAPSAGLPISLGIS